MVEATITSVSPIGGGGPRISLHDLDKSTASGDAARFLFVLITIGFLNVVLWLPMSSMSAVLASTSSSLPFSSSTCKTNYYESSVSCIIF